jgi:hypothetical protein
MDKVIRAKGGGCRAILLQGGQEGFPWNLEGGWFPSCCGYGRERLACRVRAAGHLHFEGALGLPTQFLVDCGRHFYNRDPGHHVRLIATLP